MTAQDMSSVKRSYIIGISVTMTLYVIGLFGSIYVIKMLAPPLWVRYALALAPSIPIGLSILVFLNYIKNLDEYMSAITLKTFVTATGLTLFFATLWGFMQNFADAPSVELWLTYPAFWFFYGISCLFIRQ